MIQKLTWRIARGVRRTVANGWKIKWEVGGATKSWLRNGEDQAGAGFRASAARWKTGSSGKQNEVLPPGYGCCCDLVCMFSYLLCLVLNVDEFLMYLII